MIIFEFYFVKEREYMPHAYSDIYGTHQSCIVTLQCDKCPELAVYTRKYSGQSLCSECFSKSIRHKTARTISKYDMIRRGDKVAVAVSGGKDSLSLLHILSMLSQDRGFQIYAVTIDEGIPGYRDEALHIVEKYCGKMDIPYTVTSYENMYGTTLEQALDSRTTKVTSCSLCGVLRRRAIDSAAMGADVIATAHNMDDYLQTFMINILSGDVSKVYWTNPRAGNNPARIKPFCEIYESEIVFYAFVNGIPFQTEPCPHMNEGIRTPIREFLNQLEENHSGMKNNMYASIQKIVSGHENVKSRGTCKICGHMATGEICSVCTMLNEQKMHI